VRNVDHSFWQSKLSDLSNILFMGNLLKIAFIFVPSLLILMVQIAFVNSNPPKDDHRVSSHEVNISIKTIAGELKAGKKTEFYNVEKMPNSEVVKGEKGNYYFIDLKDAETKEILHFNPGKYTIDSFDRQFSKSINRFYGDVWKIIKQDNRASIFLKGSADIIGDASFSAPIENVGCQSENFLAIAVHKEVDKGSKIYEKKPTSQLVEGKEYGNRDLPALRSRFMQCKLQETYSDLHPKILQGSVAPEVGENLRNVSLILFVPSL
jgi:hypothetical protein